MVYYSVTDTELLNGKYRLCVTSPCQLATASNTASCQFKCAGDKGFLYVYLNIQPGVQTGSVREVHLYPYLLQPEP